MRRRVMEGPSTNIEPSERAAIEAAVESYTPVTTTNLLPILQNTGTRAGRALIWLARSLSLTRPGTPFTGPNPESFIANRGRHGQALSQWVQKNSATATAIGELRPSSAAVGAGPTADRESAGAQARRSAASSTSSRGRSRQRRCVAPAVPVG
jgi:hypothetical protein